MVPFLIRMWYTFYLAYTYFVIDVIIMCAKVILYHENLWRWDSKSQTLERIIWDVWEEGTGIRERSSATGGKANEEFFRHGWTRLLRKGTAGLRDGNGLICIKAIQSIYTARFPEQTKPWTCEASRNHEVPCICQCVAKPYLWKSRGFPCQKIICGNLW